MPAMDYSKIAELYDVYATTDLDVPFFLQEARKHENILELMSGTGRLSVPLLEAGIPLACLDSSPDMLAVLRKNLRAKGLSAPVYEMDVCDLSLPAQFDLIIIPFNSFAEISDLEKQGEALKAIHTHLTDRGHFICTFHNPSVRLKGVDGQIRVRGRFPLPEKNGTLVLASFESYSPVTRLVTGAQFYELYDTGGLLISKRYLELQFYVHDRESFEILAHANGFEVSALYGDYSRNEFDAGKSPFMIWSLKKV